MSATDYRWAIRCDEVERFINLSDGAYLQAVFSFIDAETI